MDSWIRADTRAALGGWTGELPLDQYGLWWKFLKMVKAFGRRGGEIGESFFTDTMLKSMKADRKIWKTLMATATANDGVFIDGKTISVCHWSTYQVDPTATERKQRERGTKDVTPSTVTPVTDPMSRRRDGTGRDGTTTPKKESLPAETAKPPRPPKRKKKGVNPEVKEFIDWFAGEYQKFTGEKYVVTGAKEGALVKRLLGQLTLTELKKAAQGMLEDEWAGKQGHSIGLLSAQINKWRTGSDLPGFSAAPAGTTDYSKVEQRFDDKS